jgi:hypothetical protein
VKKSRTLALPISPDIHGDWVVSESYRYNNREIVPGSQLKISGERGRFTFIKHVARPNGVEWIDLFAPGEAGTSLGVYRSFRPDRIARVHRSKK